MNLAHWIERNALERPDGAAVGMGNSIVLTHAALRNRVERLAGGLKGLGLERGDRVALAMKNVPEYFEVMFAIWQAGLAAVPMNAKLHASEFTYILENSGCRACFVTPALHDTITGTNAEGLDHVIDVTSDAYASLLASEPVTISFVEPDELAWLFYTSGTTGRPKGAMLSHRNIVAMTLNYFADFDRVMPEDCIIHPAPLSHGSGMWMFPHVCAGACNIVPVSGGFDPAEIFDLIDHWNGVSMFAAPTMVRRLVTWEGNADVGNLKLIIYGGAPMYVEDCIAALDRFGPRLAQLYGQGESPMTITHLSREDIANRDHPKWRHRLGSAGVADSCMHVRVVNEQGAECPVGEKGEIVCRGGCGDARILEQSRGKRVCAARRLVVDRRCGGFRRGRLPDPHRPVKGPDHFRRHQCLSARDRRSAVADAASGGSLCGRTAAPGLGRSGCCLPGA